MDTSKMTANDCRTYWRDRVGHDDIPGDTLADMRAAVETREREAGADWLDWHARQLGALVESTGGNCEALVFHAANGLDILFTDGNAGICFHEEGAVIVVSAVDRATGNVLAADATFPVSELGADLATETALAFNGMTAAAVKTAPRV